MTPDYYLCDRCKAKIDKKHRFFVKTGRRMDPAGSMETTGEHVDLCGDCFRCFVLDEILVDEDCNKRFLVWVRSQAKKNKTLAQQ